MTGQGKFVGYRGHRKCDLRRAFASLAIALTALLLSTPLHADDYCAPVIGGSLSRPASPQLPLAAQLNISNAVGREQQAYHATLRNGAARMMNHNSALSAEFTAKQVEFRLGGDRWGMALSGVGYGANLRPVSQAAPQTSANRVEYRRGALTEWYLNGPLGVEQGLTIQQRPGETKGEPLTLAFTLSGDLAASVDAGRRGLTLAKNGSPVLRYRDLVVSDAGGRELQAWLETSGRELRIRVDDAGAAYPIVVDPVAQAAKLTSCEPANNANFGFNVALSGDGHTAVALSTGAVYVFQDGGGWGGPTPIYAAAKLVASSGINGSGGVAVNNDGTVIAVGVSQVEDFPGSEDKDGVVHIFLRPQAGWSSSIALNPNATLTATDTNPAADEGPAISADGTQVVAAFTSRHDPFNKSIRVFTQSAGGWTNGYTVATLTASDSLTQEITSVDISGDGSTVAAGFSDRQVGDNSGQGAVYLYLRPGTSWGNTSATENVQLTASDGAAADQLGIRVALDYDGGILVASAPGAGTGGAVYLYQKPGGGWATGTQYAKLTPSDPATQNTFGQGLDIDHDGNNVAVGNFPTGVTNPGVGKTYFYAKPASGWADATETQKITPADSVETDGYAYSIGLSDAGSIAAVGAPYQDLGGYTDAGAMYIFTGYAGTPTASVSPSSLTFGLQNVGTTSATQPVTLSNTGNAPLFVSSVVASSQFTTTTNCVGSVSPGASCTENVAFAPTSVGAITGTLTFSDNSGGSSTTQQVALSGTGRASVTVQNFSVYVGPSLKVINAGNSGNYAVTVVGTNGFTGQVNLSCTGGPQGTSCAMNPTSVNLSSSTTTAGATATVTIPAQAAKGNYTLTFTGISGGTTRTATATVKVVK